MLITKLIDLWKRYEKTETEYVQNNLWIRITVLTFLMVLSYTLGGWMIYFIFFFKG